MTNDYFTVREGKVTYLCQKNPAGVFLIGQQHDGSKWTRYRKPVYWGMSEKEVLNEIVPVSDAWVTAVFLMG